MAYRGNHFVAKNSIFHKICIRFVMLCSVVVIPLYLVVSCNPFTNTSLPFIGITKMYRLNNLCHIHICQFAKYERNIQCLDNTERGKFGLLSMSVCVCACVCVCVCVCVCGGGGVVGGGKGGPGGGRVEQNTTKRETCIGMMYALYVAFTNAAPRQSKDLVLTKFTRDIHS